MINHRRLLGILVIGCVGVWLFLTSLERSYRAKGENYSLIEDGLYMGGDVAEPPRGTRAVLNLCEREDRYHSEIHLWEPIPDRDPGPSLEWLRRMVKFVKANREAGLTTYVHCRNGVSRSGMVVTAYVMSKNHWTRDRALEFVRSKRPETRPNPAFMQRLLEWERVLEES